MGAACAADQPRQRRGYTLGGGLQRRGKTGSEAMKQDYMETVRLLIDIAPDIFESPRFAMKGGTALNLFLQDMQRLSVDIDVVFVDHTLSRDDALQAIASDLNDADR